MTDTGPLVTVFGVGGVEADLQAEGLIFWLFLEEIDGPVSEDLGLVALGAIFHFLEVGPAGDFSTHVPHEFGGLGCYVDVLFAKVAGAVACRFENGKIGALTECWLQGPRDDPIEMLAFIGTGEEAGSAYPAGGGGYESVLEAHSLVCQSIDVGGFDNRMPCASKGMVALIVSIEQEKIGLLGSGGW
tara:strand:+ start:180 stop:740 length:561 start_codon:yes stop_codon:yes gene_type:complete